MSFDIDRRPDALIVAGLERIDDPLVEMHAVGDFLRAHPAPLAFGLQSLPERLRVLAHRARPLRSICACSESGNCVLICCANAPAPVLSPSLRSARTPSISTSGVGGLTARYR